MGPAEHFEVFRDEAGEHRWRLVAGNGEVVAASEGYTGGAGQAEEGARTAAHVMAKATGASDEEAGNLAAAAVVSYVEEGE